jgi:predicted phage terminase large subunit-like protein
MGTVDYEAQYNQDPEAGGGLILKRKWWQNWAYPPNHPKAGEQMPYPDWEQIISVYDTAFKKGQENDYSARTSWGLFWHSHTGRKEDNCLNAMLLERMNERMEFGELREAAIRHEKGWDPDHTLIEDKASGISLIQEFETGGIPVWKVKAGPEDLAYRAHMVSGILRAGRIWYVSRDWAFDVISQCAKFPMVEHDDLVATCVIAWAFMRRMGDMELPDDEKSNELALWTRPKPKSPYG